MNGRLCCYIFGPYGYERSVTFSATLLAQKTITEVASVADVNVPSRFVAIVTNPSEGTECAAFGEVIGGAAQGTRRFRLTRPVEIRIPAEELNKAFPQVPPGTQGLLDFVGVPDWINDEVLFGDAAKTLLNVIKTLRPKVSAAVSELEMLAKITKVSEASTGAQIAELERDAIVDALDAFAYDRVGLLGATDPIDLTAPAPFIKNLKRAVLREDTIVAHDQRTVDGWSLVSDHVVEYVVLRRGDERMTVLNVNRGSVEHASGVDLIFYNHRYDSYTCLQYKRSIERQSDGWSVPIDGQFEKELKLMLKFLPLSDANVPEAREYRLASCPFYFKMCDSVTLDPLSTRPVPGAYVPARYIQSLIQHGKAKGVRGGVAITRKNSERWLDHSAFINLMQRGFIGSSQAGSHRMKALIEASLAGDRSAILAITEGGHNVKGVGPP